ncbi:hypothetical protein J2I47_10465 [Fibrella sp. HMF5335]|uniref:DUF4843 domain-containing protein n=1 Tax=Fibrella rubiginis TaxID=2817060 RepID=A0A939K1B0_9BACT|nr:hypothetical protein [Fibrella rubiginis]MBO0936967.1 hypothetical protein [Fibrella rubiginis]
MKKILFLLSLTLAAGLSACQQDKDAPGIRDLLAVDNAVTYTNYKYLERIPIYETSIAAGGKIEITMTLPSTSPRAFTEITQVGASTTNATINQSTFKTAANTFATKIAASGKTATFSTTVDNYLAFKKLKTLPANTALGATYADIQLFFVLTLDDGTTVVPIETRVRVRP